MYHFQDISHPQKKHWFNALVLWNSLWAGQSGDQIPVGVRFSALIQTGPWATQPPIQWLLGFSRG